MKSRNTNPSEEGFKNYIEGLRAWAVVMVILYHFDIPGFPGGFIGVDVFFTISGYLMTRIITSGLENNNFSLLNFLLARARRILPALIFLCCLLLIFGWFTLLPPGYEILAKSSAYATTFLSNILFWSEAGYFDSGSKTKWLLHTWSLSVEWQFYILFPIFLMIIWRLSPRRKSIQTSLLLIFAISLCISIWGTPLHPKAAFFLLPTRAWEMCAGGLVHLTALGLKINERQRIWLEFAGFSTLIASLIAFDSNSPWPGLGAILPTVGTMAILLAANTKSYWTGTKFTQLIGRHSYSLYLWHWPIAVYLNLMDWQSDPFKTSGALILTLFMGWFSLSYVEFPARKYLGQLNPISSSTILIISCSFIILPGLFIAANQGIQGRFPNEIENLMKDALKKRERHEQCNVGTGIESPSCMYGGSNLKAIVLGDSHVGALITAISAATGNENDGVMDWGYNSCPIIFDTKSNRFGNQYKCDEFLRWVDHQLKSTPKNIPLIITNRMSLYPFGLNPFNSTPNPFIYFKESKTKKSSDFMAIFSSKYKNTICHFAQERRVFLMRPIPEMESNVPDILAQSTFAKKIKDITMPLNTYNQRHRYILELQDQIQKECGVDILDPVPFLCKDEKCLGSINGKALYYDDNHLNEYGNKFLIPMFEQVFQNNAPLNDATPQKPDRKS